MRQTLRSIPIFAVLLSGFLTGELIAQNKVVITGKVFDRFDNQPVELALAYIDGTQNVVETDARGAYRVETTANTAFKLIFSRIGYLQAEREVTAHPDGTQLEINVYLVRQGSDLEVIVTERQLETSGMLQQEVDELKLIPTTTGNLESVLPHIALGTSSGTGGELTSQYSVRGGNYDENLVYVNDFEVYRPQLIRQGQQEGLSFPNIDLIRDLSFSSGGFESKYGDKLSSVLDIKYKRPDSTKASVGLSLLGATAHLEGSKQSKLNPYQHFRYLIGARYKTTQYLLSSLDTKGEYTPNFFDLQTYLTYDISRSLQVGFMGNFNASVYDFVPISRETAEGLIDFALRLSTQFQGQEVDDFTNGMGGLALTYIPDKERNPIFLKLLASNYQSRENERLDIQGAYRLSQIETNLGSEDAGEEILVLGTGVQHEYVRDFLRASVSNIEHKGGIELQAANSSESDEKTHFLQWGAKVQREHIRDKINEWERLDSAGYSLAFDPNEVRLQSVLKSKNDLISNRLSGYFQNSYTRIVEGKAEYRLTMGVRASYWDLNKETVISPRAQFLFKPLTSDKDISFRLSAGLYHQPPFYREMRGPDGLVNTNLKAQKSFHLVGGMTMDFGRQIYERKKYRLILEAYYKNLWDLVSYELDNVRIRYSGQNDASGSVMGIDLRVNGEFVPGAESWINLSFLRARESLTDVQHLRRDLGEEDAREVKSVPRPTDQLLNLNMFFQDYLPRNENFKMHLNLSVGTGLPYGIKDNNAVYRNTYRYDPYQRVDIGFSIALWERAWRARKPQHLLRFSRSAWASLEIFNLLQIRNEASKTWVKTVYNQQFAVSNFLTSRRVNLRFKVDL